MTAIIDYDTGNIRSVENALKRLGAEYVLSSDKSVMDSCERLILPGVGEAAWAMAKLRDRGLDGFVRSCTKPVFGICLGMQLLCSWSEEGDTECLGIFPWTRNCSTESRRARTCILYTRISLKSMNIRPR